jgi:hypothetical protein
MTITKARIIKKFNDVYRYNLATNSTDLDDLITDALVELSTMGDFLHDEVIIDTAEDSYIYQLPEDYKSDLVVKLDNNHSLEYWDFSKIIKYLNSTPTGTPHAYSISRGYVTDGQSPNLFFYLYPVPDNNDGSNYTLRLFFTAYHPRTITVDSTEYNACDYIKYPEKMETLVKYLVLAKWASDKNLDADANKYYSLFSNSLNMFKSMEDRVARHVVYKDLIR